MIEMVEIWYYIILPPILAFASLFMGFDQGGGGLPAPLGSIIFFFAPLIATVWYLEKKGMNILIGIIIGYLIACTVYWIAILSRITHVFQLL